MENGPVPLPLARFIISNTGFLMNTSSKVSQICNKVHHVELSDSDSDNYFNQVTRSFSNSRGIQFLTCVIFPCKLSIKGTGRILHCINPPLIYSSLIVILKMTHNTPTVVSPCHSIATEPYCKEYSVSKN